MQAQPSPKPHVSGSSATATNSCDFIETLEYSRFIEFCDACRQYRYIGLCFGAPGIGKTLSAAQYSRRDEISGLSPWTVVSIDPPLDTVLYTPPVVNTPGRVDTDLRQARETLCGISARPLRAEAREVLDQLRRRDDAWRREYEDDSKFDGSRCPPFEPTYFQVFQQYEDRKRAVTDPTTLILIDEADRLGMNSLEQVRSIFDTSEIGIVLIGMPGIEKRMARFPQFYSRIGFVHEFRPLAADEVHRLLRGGWMPPWGRASRCASYSGGPCCHYPHDRWQFPVTQSLAHSDRACRSNQSGSKRLTRHCRRCQRKPRHRPDITASEVLPRMNIAQISTTNNSQDNSPDRL